MNIKKIKIGILGGTFDPAHRGHLIISKESKKRLGLEQVIWAITKKNPSKRLSNTNISTRIKFCKKIIGTNNFIKVKFYENIIKSNKTFNLIDFFSKNKRIEIYFLMGADNLIGFHKWYKWQLIAQKCNIVVFIYFTLFELFDKVTKHYIIPYCIKTDKHKRFVGYLFR